MKLSVSNIAWSNSDDNQVYEFLSGRGIIGLEIAPTRIFPDSPYERLEEAGRFRKNLEQSFSMSVSSIQSIWYGRKERMFGSDAERGLLLAYTKKAIEFAVVLNCRNLVFGCPKNRVVSCDGDYDTALRFFHELGEYAMLRGTVLAIEANPTIYGTNFINTTEQAFEIVKRVSSEGCKVNIDLGTMIYNGESLGLIDENLQWVNHIHISEPGLQPISRRRMHKDLARILDGRYHNYLSIEMGRQDQMQTVYDAIDYVKETMDALL